MSEPRRGWRTLPWGVIDQFFSAGSNALIVVLAARRLDADELGRFSLVISAALILLGIARSWLGQPLIIAHAAELPTALRTHSLAAVAGAVRFGAVATLVALLTAVPSGHARAVVTMFAFGAIALVVQDTIRSVYFVQSRPWGAATCDGVWLLWVIGAMVWSAADADAPLRSGAALVAVWSAGALVAALAALVHLRLLAPLVRSLRTAWFRAHASLGWGLLADTSLVTLYGFAIPFVLAAVATVDDAGSFRLAQTLTGPATLVTVGAATQLLPSLVRARVDRRPIARRAAMLYAAISATYTAAVIALPQGWGEELFGSAWRDARPTAIALGAAAVAGAIVMPALLLLRSAAATTLLARTRLWLFPMQLAAVVAGAAWSGADGAAMGLACGNWCSAPVWWWVALRRDRRAVLSSN